MQLQVFSFFVGCIAIACAERSMLALRLCILHWARAATHTEAYTMSTVSLRYYHVPAQSHAQARTMHNNQQSEPPTVMSAAAGMLAALSTHQKLQQILRG